MNCECAEGMPCSSNLQQRDQHSQAVWPHIRRPHAATNPVQTGSPDCGRAGRAFFFEGPFQNKVEHLVEQVANQP